MRSLCLVNIMNINCHESKIFCEDEWLMGKIPKKFERDFYLSSCNYSKIRTAFTSLVLDNNIELEPKCEY